MLTGFAEMGDGKLNGDLTLNVFGERVRPESGALQWLLKGDGRKGSDFADIAAVRRHPKLPAITEGFLGLIMKPCFKAARCRTLDAGIMPKMDCSIRPGSDGSDPVFAIGTNAIGSLSSIAKGESVPDFDKVGIGCAPCDRQFDIPGVCFRHEALPFQPSATKYAAIPQSMNLSSAAGGEGRGVWK
jgi:hypothetical protein